MQYIFAAMEIIFRLEQLEVTAKKFRETMGDRTVFAFYGDMGAGKTTFITAVCKTLGVRETVSSPTFSIVNEYNAAGRRIFHLDLYRLKDSEEAVNAGVEDVLFSGDTCFVEWPERAPEVFPPDTVNVTLEAMGNGARKLSVQ
jgi:tRNA threonylcarbamoyladenosine biosynthesis protein TsaE